jgi:paraquat-inducible protein B
MKSLANLEHSLDDVRSITADTRRQIRPILAAVQRTAAQAQDAVESARAVLGNGGGSSENAAQTAALPGTLYELTRAARSLRELSDYLDRHPEALIEGKGGHS